MGVTQASNNKPSRLHSKPVRPLLSVPLIVKVIDVNRADPPFVTGAPAPSTAEVIIVSGGVVSWTVIVKDTVAVLPAASVAVHVTNVGVPSGAKGAAHAITIACAITIAYPAPFPRALRFQSITLATASAT